jgi:amino acid transporter
MVRPIHPTTYSGDELTGEKIVACGIVAVITLIKLGGTDYIVKASTIFFFFSMTPAVIYMVYGSKDIHPESLISTDTSEEAGGFDPAKLLSWVTWLYCGFNSLGALAGEVGQHATYSCTLHPLCRHRYHPDGAKPPFHSRATPDMHARACR